MHVGGLLIQHDVVRKQRQGGSHRCDGARDERAPRRLKVHVRAVHAVRAQDDVIKAIVVPSCLHVVLRSELAHPCRRWIDGGRALALRRVGVVHMGAWSRQRTQVGWHAGRWQSVATRGDVP